MEGLDKSTADSLSKSFKKELDLNQDGYLDKVCTVRAIFVGSG